MRPWHWILASSVVLSAAPARAEETPAPKPSEVRKTDPSAKAGRCAGKSGPVQGCTGFKPSLRLRPEARKTAKADTGPRTPALDKTFIQQIRTDPPLQKQSDHLLKVEIGRLEHLLSMTPRNAPDRALLVRRLADGYAELAARAARQQLVAEEMVRASEAQKKEQSPR